MTVLTIVVIITIPIWILGGYLFLKKQYLEFRDNYLYERLPKSTLFYKKIIDENDTSYIFSRRR